MGEKEVMRLLKLLELHKVEKQKKIESKWKEITMKDRKKKSKEEVEEDWRNKNKRRKKSREEVEITGGMENKEWKKQENSNVEEKMLYL